eukprot:scaffold21_cov107-Cylindrotheca_fusiformis.AAC.14
MTDSRVLEKGEGGELEKKCLSLPVQRSQWQERRSSFFAGQLSQPILVRPTIHFGPSYHPKLERIGVLSSRSFVSSFKNPPHSDCQCSAGNPFGTISARDFDDANWRERKKQY